MKAIEQAMSKHENLIKRIFLGEGAFIYCATGPQAGEDCWSPQNAFQISHTNAGTSIHDYTITSHRLRQILSVGAPRRGVSSLPSYASLEKLVLETDISR